MAQQYDDTNRGALFGNKNKREGKKDPDLQGKIDVGGTEYWISGWFKTYEKDGETRQMVSLALGDPVEQKAKPAPAKRGGAFDGMRDDIPFRQIATGIAGHAE